MGKQLYVKEEMEELSKDPNVIFIGYNLKYGSKNYNCLKDVSSEKILEMPVAENLMTGIAIGMSLEGFKPVLIFERHDFMLLALDQIVNHLDKIEKMSEGQFKPTVIIRAIVGGTKPFNPDEVHKQDFTEIFKKICNFPVKRYKKGIYLEALKNNQTIMGIEYRDLDLV